MKYIKVQWIHSFDDEPVLLYSELTDSQFELRKIEIFPDSTYGVASEDFCSRGTQLSEIAIPTEDEISKDPQFVVEVISKNTFENIWMKSINSLGKS